MSLNALINYYPGVSLVVKMENNGEGGIVPGELSSANQMSHLGLNEYYSGFENVGHNDPISLIFLWIIPK